jgi:hypothetical protein
MTPTQLRGALKSDLSGLSVDEQRWCRTKGLIVDRKLDPALVEAFIKQDKEAVPSAPPLTLLDDVGTAQPKADPRQPNHHLGPTHPFFVNRLSNQT